MRRLQSLDHVDIARAAPLKLAWFINLQ